MADAKAGFIQAVSKYQKRRSHCWTCTFVPTAKKVGAVQ